MNLIIYNSKTIKSKALEVNDEWDYLNNIKEDDECLPYYLYTYAKNIIKGRWLEAEEYISKDPMISSMYAEDIIRGRWPEAEEIIKKDPKSIFSYILNIIGGRWPEAEETIKKDPMLAVYYSTSILKRRWPEAEEYIKLDNEQWETYQYKFSNIKKEPLYIDLIIYNDDPNSTPKILKVNQKLWDYHQYIREDDEKLPLCLYCYVRDTKKRFPEAEKYIKLDPYWAYLYALNFIKGRWPEAEPYIKLDPYWSYKYAIEVIKGRWPEAENVLKTMA